MLIPRQFSTFMLAAALCGCASNTTTAQEPSTDADSTLTISSKVVNNNTKAKATPPAPSQQELADFTHWRNDFRARALAKGITPSTFDNAFANVSVNPQVVKLDGNQAEFTRQIWDYLDTATSASRVSNGQQQWQPRADTLAAIEQRYGVDAQVVMSVWGMETNYGSYRGNTNTIEGLATLAFEGRRRTFAEAQLIAALQILQAGDVTSENMRGSWAGAMGHTQFMPTSYLEYAQDFTGNGKRDIWADDPTDALASTAYYLSRFGWEKGAPWGVEIQLPKHFDYSQAEQNNRQPVAYWQQRGITTIDGEPLPDFGKAAILVPAGANGPAFAIFNNFRVIRRYNNATSYALAVGHLADKLAGGSDFVTPWPRHETPLSRSQKVQLQQKLTAKGFDTKGVDGVIGPNTTNAIRAYQQSTQQTADGYANITLLKQLN